MSSLRSAAPRSVLHAEPTLAFPPGSVRAACRRLLVTLGLFSHDPTNAARDFLGTPGDWLAVSLYQSLGIAVYFLLAGWLVLVALLFRCRSWLRWSFRVAGWLLLLPCSAVVADYLGTQLPGTSPLGPGGSIGAWLRLARDEFRSHEQNHHLHCQLACGRGPGGGLCRDSSADRLMEDRLLAGSPTGSACGRLLAVLPRWRRRGCKMPKALARRANGAPRGPLPTPHVAFEKSSAAVSQPVGLPPKPAPPEDQPIPIQHHDQAVAGLAANLANGVAAVARAVAGQKAQTPDAVRFANFELPPLTLLEDSQPFPLPGSRELPAPACEPAGKDLCRLRPQCPRRRHQHRAGHHAVRDRLETGLRAQQSHDACRRPGTESEGAERSHRRARSPARTRSASRFPTSTVPWSG